MNDAEKAILEMLRYLPLLERAEKDPEIWEKLTAGSGLGIATLNGYREKLEKAVASCHFSDEPHKSQYSPFVLPFAYNMGAQVILDARNNTVLDVRGWGFLTGQGTLGQKLSEDEAMKIQDGIGLRVAQLMNRDAGVGEQP